MLTGQPQALKLSILWTILIIDKVRIQIIIHRTLMLRQPLLPLPFLLLIQIHIKTRAPFDKLKVDDRNHKLLLVLVSIL